MGKRKVSTHTAGEGTSRRRLPRALLAFATPNLYLVDESVELPFGGEQVGESAFYWSGLRGEIAFGVRLLEHLIRFARYRQGKGISLQIGEGSSRCAL